MARTITSNEKNFTGTFYDTTIWYTEGLYKENIYLYAETIQELWKKAYKTARTMLQKEGDLEFTINEYNNEPSLKLIKKYPTIRMRNYNYPWSRKEIYIDRKNK